MMKAKICESIAEIGEKEWDAIVGRDRLICTHKYLEAVEKSQINDCCYYYPVIYDGDEIIAHASVYSISTEMDTFARGAVKKAINLIRRVWKGFFILRSLECGTPVALGNTISFKDGADKAAVLRLLAQQIENLAKKIKVKTVLFRDFYNEELSLFDSLKELGYTRINNLPDTIIKVGWKSFDEYLDMMRNHYKGKVKRNMRKFYKKEITVELLKNFSTYADELERLWRMTYGRAAEYKREILTSIFFKNINEYLGDRSAVVLVRKDNIPIGFFLLLFGDEVLTPLFCGLDYRYSEEYSIYFNLFYQTIDIGIKEGVKYINTGITALSIKKDLGAVIFPLSMYMKHISLFFNKVVPRIFSVMTPQYNDKPRNIFKIDRNKNNIRGDLALGVKPNCRFIYQ